MKLHLSIFPLIFLLSVNASSSTEENLPLLVEEKTCEAFGFEAQDSENFPEFPVEILEMILWNATLKDIYNFCQTSKANFRIFELDKFWALLSKRDFPLASQLLEKEPENGWKEYYKYCLKSNRRFPSFEPIAWDPAPIINNFDYCPPQYSLNWGISGGHIWREPQRGIEEFISHRF